MDTPVLVDWHAYNASAAARPARRLVPRAIAAAGGDAGHHVAIEIGAGGGADAIEFARHGWTVHAYDTDDTLTQRLVENERTTGRIQFHHVDAATVETFPAADVVYAGYALPMLGPDGLAATWPRLVAALKIGGVMAVDLFGDDDTWAERDDIATLSAQQIGEMFRGFRVLDREVRNEDGRSYQSDKKHWHVITTLARRLS
jgi:trans-aconitate methyltransferase